MKRVILVATIVCVTNAYAQAFMKNDPKRPVAAIAKELGVTPDQFVKCFDNVKPAPQGLMPSGERQQSNKKILLPCLQKFNPDITNDSLDRVMDKYRK